MLCWCDDERRSCSRSNSKDPASYIDMNLAQLAHDMLPACSTKGRLPGSWSSKNEALSQWNCDIESGLAVRPLEHGDL